MVRQTVPYLLQTDERRWGESQPSYFCPDMKQEAISTLSFLNQ